MLVAAGAFEGRRILSADAVTQMTLPPRGVAGGESDTRIETRAREFASAPALFADE